MRDEEGRCVSPLTLAVIALAFRQIPCAATVVPKVVERRGGTTGRVPAEGQSCKTSKVSAAERSSNYDYHHEDAHN